MVFPCVERPEGRGGSVGGGRKERSTTNLSADGVRIYTKYSAI